MSATAFSSVKLPAHLVEQARQAAQPMRRSVASQIEYWATLGQIVEHTGLSVSEARSAIEQYEAAALRHHTLAAPASVDALTARLLAAQTRGTLAQRVREVVQENQAKAGATAA
ncbi:TA system antitoxin ParD family protein [Acidovorax sp. LjRoot117]|uniref:TA system antitoxin ParD family protein n=1 Tax=Acidovorax sp. LjRoot117 TaxID=3342255 RepID=UPI003ECFAB6E